MLAQLDEVRFAPDLYALEVSQSGVDAIIARNLSRVREVRCFDGYAAPYPDKCFDLAIATHVVEHVEHERLFLRELKRIARFVFLEVLMEDTFRMSVSLTNEIGHIIFYRRERFLALLASIGLRPIRYRVFDYSLTVSTFHAGWLKGLPRHVLRRLILAAWPGLAQSLFLYHRGVLAEPG